MQKAFELYKKLKIRYLEGQFNLRKWRTNNPVLRKLIKNCENVSSDSNFNNNAKKHLGLIWDDLCDILQFDFTEICNHAEKLTATKRNVLKILASFYDPLGLIQPIIISLKVLFQKICKSTSDWDEPIQNDILHEWNKTILEMSKLKSISVKRCYMITEVNDPFVTYELHGFSDASPQAYSAAVYLRGITQSGSIKITLVSSKSRVAPLKSDTTIPRLELMGNLFLARLCNNIYSVLNKQINQTEIFYWTYNKITLAWIISFQKEYKTFVENRVQKIRKLTKFENWRYCSTENNPADLITHTGVSPLTMNEKNCGGLVPSF